MAEPVSYTVDDLRLKLADAFMECSARAKREDDLVALVKQLQGRNAELVAELETLTGGAKA